MDIASGTTIAANDDDADGAVVPLSSTEDEGVVPLSSTEDEGTYVGASVEFEVACFGAFAFADGA